MILVSLAARAQDVPDLDAQTFHTSVDGRAGFSLDDGIVAPDRQLAARALFQNVNDPLVWVGEDGSEVAGVSDLVVMDALASLTLRRLRLGVDLPVVFAAYGQGLDGGAALGDLALDARYAVLDPVDAPLGLAPTVRVAIPTAGAHTPVGSRGFDALLGVAASRAFGDWLVAGNLGVHVLPSVDLGKASWGTQLALRAGVARGIGDSAGVTAELDVSTVLIEPFSNPAQTPAEGVLGGWYRVREHLVLRGGVGTGLSRGIGAPDARVLLALGYEPSLERDRDRDGISDATDVCRDAPEDIDAFEDADGCPEADNDADGVADAQDRCPLEPEDPDGWQDDDGCADPTTRVRIVVVDPAGRPIAGARVVVGGDPVPGPEHTAELLHGHHGLRIEADGYISLTSEMVVPDGPPIEVVERLDPVPPPKPTAEARVVVTREKIEFWDKIYFDTGKSTIKRQSFGLLDEIAEVVREHPELRRIRVEGHTDARGDAKKNAKLSQGRADAVLRYLTGAGVPAERLHAVGYGEDRPVDPTQNEAAWEKNRRVEFVIEERAE